MKNKNPVMRCHLYKLMVLEKDEYIDIKEKLWQVFLTY